MSRKPVRFGLLIVGLLVTAALAYRVVDDEASLGRAYRERLAHDHAAGQALEALLDLRASLHAYVAPGQGIPFWSGRSEQQLDRLREQLVTLDAALAPAGSLADALDAVDQLAAAERRSRDHARRGEPLLAGDIVFTETRDLSSGTIERIHAARAAIATADDRRISALRREQALLAGGALAVWLVIALLFVTPTKPEIVKDPNAWRDELAQTLKKPVQKEPERKPGEPIQPVEPVAPVVPVVPVERVEPAEPSVPVRALRDVSEIVSDLSALSDTGALSGALTRAASVLDANGVIVWVASNDGGTLSPVASHGFDVRLVSRIGRIARDAANLTAMAFRENGARVSAATATAPAALAVALCGPSGPVGVLSVELKPGVPADEGRVMVATIFAAQLATLAAPVPSLPRAPVAPAPPEKVEQPQRAAL